MSYLDLTMFDVIGIVLVAMTISSVAGYGVGVLRERIKWSRSIKKGRRLGTATSETGRRFRHY